MEAQMKAIVCTRYGSPDILQLREVARPIPKEDEALVKVHATSLNAADLETLRGMFVIRIVAPARPMHKILGTDVAGRVEAVGINVKRFQPGDEIWGDLSFPLGSGTFAEYVCIPEEALRLKPASMTFEQAAAVPTAAVVALQKLRYRGPIQPGHKVLINGAGGGVGTFAVQLAKYFGAEVTGVDSTEKLDMLRSIGADQVIDYTQEDFTQNEQRYDLILDIKAYRSISDYEHALGPKGVYVLVGGSVARILQASMSRNERMVNFQVRPSQEDLFFVKQLVEASKVVPVIDRRFQFSEVAEAVRYYGEGHARGKVVITVQYASGRTERV
jgi:NADPH:quinone reductase-like Zn-dependent oxidoreductase